MKYFFIIFFFAISLFGQSTGIKISVLPNMTDSLQADDMLLLVDKSVMQTKRSDFSHFMNSVAQKLRGKTIYGAIWESGLTGKRTKISADGTVLFYDAGGVNVGNIEGDGGYLQIGGLGANGIKLFSTTPFIGSASGGSFLIQAGNGFQTTVSDINYRSVKVNGGDIWFGADNDSSYVGYDVKLYRGSANLLKTDDTLSVKSLYLADAKLLFDPVSVNIKIVYGGDTTYIGGIANIDTTKAYNWLGLHNWRTSAGARLDIPAVAANNIGAIAWNGELVVGTGTGTNTMVRVEGTYSDPAWLTALAWSKISSKPTTLAGYGITDGVSLSGTNIWTGNNYFKAGLTHIRDAEGDDGTITGSFTLDRTFTLPDKDGTFAMTSDLSSYALTNQTMYLGTTAVAINRGSGALSLSGVSISGNAGTVTDGVYLSGNNAFTGANTISSSLTITSTGALYLSSYAPVGLKGAIYHDNGATAKLMYSTNSVGGSNTIASEAWVSAQGYSILPSQTGNSGKFLTTNGTATSWATVGGVDPSADYNWTGIHDFTKAVTTSTNLVSSLISSGTSGVTNKAIVGTATSTATPTAQNLYGGYFSATGYNSGGSNGYGIYATATGSTNNYAGYFVGNVYSSGIYSGDGSGLTALNGTNISSGTVADARLSTNVPLKNGANTFSATQTLQADVIMQANVRYTPSYVVGTIGTPSAADKAMVHLNPSSAQSTTTISDGTNGDIITFVNISSTNTFTFTLSGGNLVLPGGADVVLGNGDSITFTYITTNSYNKWVCTAYSNN